MTLDTHHWTHDFSPSVRRILLHSLLFSIAATIADILLGFYIVSIGLSTTDLGLLSTMLRVAGMLTAMPIGLLIDRIGAQRAIILGVGTYALSWVILLAVETRPALFAAQFLVGTAILLASTAVQPLLAQHADEQQRAGLFGVNVFMIVGAGMVGGVLGGILPSWAALLPQVEPQSATAYRIALVGLIVIAVLAVLPLLGALPHGERRHATTAAGSEQRTRPPVSQLRIIRLGLPSLMVGCAAGTIIPFQALFFRDTFTQTDAAVGLILGLSALGSGIGALLGAPLTQRIGARQSTTLLRVLAAPSTLLMLVPNLWAAAVGLTLRGIFISASWAQGDALIVGLTPAQQRGRLMAMNSLLWSAGWAITSALSGWITPLYGYLPQFMLAALMYALSAWAVWTVQEG